MAWNNSIFRDEVHSTSRVETACLGLFEHFKSLGRVGVGNLWDIKEEVIDKERLWAYFDGAASGDQLMCGGVVVFTLPLSFFSSQVWVGSRYK
jgi:hypothetical protein